MVPKSATGHVLIFVRIYPRKLLRSFALSWLKCLALLER
jgi:hypothetical protein